MIYIDFNKMLCIIKPQGQGQIIIIINEAFTTLIICSEFQKKKTVLNSYFIRLSHDFIHAGTGTANSNGMNFKHCRKLLSLISFSVSFRSTALNSDFT